MTAEAEEGLVVSLATVSLIREKDGAAALKRLIATLATRKQRLDVRRPSYLVNGSLTFDAKDQLSKLSTQQEQIEGDVVTIDQRLARLDDEQANLYDERKYQVRGWMNWCMAMHLVTRQGGERLGCSRSLAASIASRSRSGMLASTMSCLPST